MKPENLIKISRSQFRLDFDTISPEKALSDRKHEFEEADLEDDPGLKALVGTYTEPDEDHVLRALSVLLSEIESVDYDLDWYSSRIDSPRRVRGAGVPACVACSEDFRRMRESDHEIQCRTFGHVTFDATKWTEGDASRELQLRIQRWLSACRMVGGVDEIIYPEIRQERLNKLGEVVGGQWGTHDSYMAQAALIDKEYESRRGMVWVGGLCFEEALARLDFYLTGKDAGNPASANWSYPKHPEDVLGSHNIVYLSDGGYSRLVFHQIEEDGKEVFRITLTDGSRDEVKAKFEEQLAFILRIEYAATEWFKIAMENA